MLCKLIRQVFCVLILGTTSVFADNGAEHLRKYANGIDGDKTIEAAKKLNVKIPVMCREWHVWWRAPYGNSFHVPMWFHWKGQRMFGKFDPSTTIEQTRPGLSWRRWLNCTGYPLLGPYDSAQPDIIRWQLETAKNAGLECLHIHLWPSIWDEGKDFSPIPIFDRLMETAAKMKYPVAVHDEIQFRRPPITKAQQLNNCIERSVILLKRYGKHPGWYKIDNMPVYYFQNWNKWLSAKDMAAYFKTVEKRVGFPVYWIIEMGNNDEYFKIPEVKAVVSHSNLWFLHTKPFGKGPHPWKALLKNMNRSAKLARKYNKKFGVLLMTRFNHTHDRGKPEKPQIMSGENGMFLVESIRKYMTMKPDFMIITQWNDFEESAFVEPAWDFDGNNGDPYRYCRIIAASVNKKFTPAQLPKREQLDPFIRRKLFGDAKKGDMGPIFQKPRLSGKKLTVDWTKDAKPDHVRLIQNNLGRWTAGLKPFNAKNSLRLANYSMGSGVIAGKDELRFFAPGMVGKSPRKLWLGIRVYHDPKTRLIINYRAYPENFRVDSAWKRASASFSSGYTFKMPDKTVFYWVPLYDAQFAGTEGDITVRLSGNRMKTYVSEVLVWSPEMDEVNVVPSKSMQVPEEISTDRSFVAVAYDKLDNPGQPMLIIPAEETAGRKTANKLSGDFTETFETLGKWKNISGAKPVLIEFSPGNTDVPFLALSNSVVAATLPEPMSALTLKIEMQQRKYSRGQWVALFDRSGRKGIGFLWDSSLEKMFNGQGFLSIIKFDLDKNVGFSSRFKKLTNGTASGVKVNGDKMEKFELNITAKSIVLKFGSQTVKTANPMKEPFEQILIRGNDTGFFDNLSITKE